MNFNTEAQRRRGLKNLFLLGVLCASAVSFVSTVSAQESLKITITADKAWLRNEPRLTAGNTAPVAKGQFYDVVGRTPDGAWWKLNVPEAKGGMWLLADLGAPYAGDVMTAPVAQAQAVPSTKATKKTTKKVKEAPFPAWVPKITPEQRGVWQAAVAAGKDPYFFTVVGDCNSQPPVYLQRLASGQFDASSLSPRMQAIVQQFAKSFGRISLAAKGGFGSAAMMDPAWADGALCTPTTGDSAYACELRVSRASIVFISLGTQEQYDWKNFEKNFRPLIEHAKAKGVLPVLVTKADDIETAAGAESGTINTIIRKLAQEYNVPLLDFFAATRELPYGGLINESDRNFHQSYLGMDRRILVTLQTLAAITGK